MLNRWFSAPRSSSSDANGGGHDETPTPKEADFIVLPAAASDSWRTWLMTGVRKPPFDRRRVRGAHKGLKKMLVEGTISAEGPLPWNDFSSAMVRQAVDEALNALPAGHKQAVKLAYFGGFSNEEIASHLGVGEGAVRRRLREALAKVSEHVEMGRAAARRTIYVVSGWFALRSLVDSARRVPAVLTDHLAQAAVVVACGAMTAAMLASTAPSPAQLSQVAGGGVSGSTSSGLAKSSVSLPKLPVNPGSVTVSPPAQPTLPGRSTLPGGVTPPSLPPVKLPPIKLTDLRRIL
jgi:predicted DNA-binding protein (UPF0251 family)